MANDITYKIGVEESISPALNKIQSSVAKTSAAFSRLQAAIGGIAFGAAIQSALSYADAIADISDATEIGIANVLGFGNAVSQLGGNAEKAQSAIAKFSLTVGDALNGSLNAQNSFNDLGISLRDLARLDTQGLFDLTLKKLSELDDVTKRNRISSELFGKTLRGVNLKNLYDEYGRLTEAGRKYADDIKRGAELQDKLSGAMSKFKLEVLKAIAPLIDFVNELKPGQIEAFVKAVVQIGGAAVAITTLVTAVKGLSGLFVGGAGVLLGYWAIFTKGALQAGATIAGLSIRWNGFLKGLAAATGVFAKLGQVGTFLFNTFSKTIPFLLGGLARMIPFIGAVVSALYLVNEGIKMAFDIDPIDLFLTKVADAYYAFKEFIGLQGRQAKDQPAGPVGNAGRGDAQAQLKDYQKQQEALAAEAEKMKEIQKNLEIKRATIREITVEFKKQLDNQIAQLTLSGQLVGKSETQKEIMAAVAAVTKEAADKTDELRLAMSKLQGTEKDELTGTYQAQIAEIEKLKTAKIAEITAAIKANAQLKAQEDIRLFDIKETNQAFDDMAKIQKEISQIGFGDQAKAIMDVAYAADERARAEIRALEASRNEQLGEEEKARIFAISRASTQALTDATNQLADAREKFAQKESLRLFDLKTEYDLQDKLLALQREVADIGLTDIEKKYRDITRAADDSAKAAIRAEEERRSAIAGTKVLLDPDEAAEYYKRARAGTEQLLQQQKKLYDSTRTFSTGWKNAFKQYVDNATNAAKTAERVFEKFTSGLEDAIVGFAKTGKFEWKSFVDSMLEELLRSQIKQTMASILQLSNPFGSGTVSDMFGGLFGGLLGDSGASKGQSPNNPMYVFDVAGGGSGASGGPLGGLLGGNNNDSMISGGGFGGGGIMSGIGKVASGIGGAISSVASGIGSVIGGISDTVGSIFGGGGGDSGGGFLDSISSGIGSLFDGWFANGGNIGAGKFGIVGENGPEFVGGPASVSPMSGTTNVTYNISAVDAASFQALVARDPGFIYGVSEAGRRSAAGSRR